MSVVEEDDYDSETEIKKTDNSILNCSDTESMCHSQASRANDSDESEISSVDTSNIEIAIALNKLTDDKWKKFEEMLLKRLKECKKKLAALSNQNNEKSLEPSSQKIYVCGKPYFKDPNGYPAPPNSDTLLMQKSEMYDQVTVYSVPGWTVKDKRSLTKLMLQFSKDIKQTKLYSKISQLKRQNRTKSTSKEIKKIERQINSLDSCSLTDVALPLNEEYDWDIIANKLLNRHTALEYRALWKLFLHPTINKKPWSWNEHNEMYAISKKTGQQDWDAIAAELNTGRTGYQCFIYHRTCINETNGYQKWSEEEDEYLKRLIECYRENDYIPWGKVAAQMENRTKSQIYNRWNNCSKPKIKKGRFLPEEDTVLLTCVDKFGHNFSKIAQYIAGRTACQVRTRYGILVKRRLSVTWTSDEDRKLVQLLSNQTGSLLDFSGIVKHFPGKDRANIRTRYRILEKWMKNNPTLDIIHAPRKLARRLIHGRPTMSIKTAVEKLNTRLQSEVKTRKKRITEDSNHEELDEAIVRALINENLLEEKSDPAPEAINNIVTSKNMDVANLHRILVFLKANFDKVLFEQGPYSKDYKDLLQPLNDVAVVHNVRSYSRKENCVPPKVSIPDIWGNPIADNYNYVLPPHFATITGCKQFMSNPDTYVYRANLYTIAHMCKVNKLFKQQWTLLTERFEKLFLWPMLLSNKEPIEKS